MTLCCLFFTTYFITKNTINPINEAPIRNETSIEMTTKCILYQLMACGNGFAITSDLFTRIDHTVCAFLKTLGLRTAPKAFNTESLIIAEELNVCLIAGTTRIDGFGTGLGVWRSVQIKRYEEYNFIQYECDSEDKLLVGNSTMRCINGKWIGNLPRCALESKSSPKSLIIPDYMTGKKLYRFFGQFFKGCYKPEFSWNITSSQRVSIQLQNEDRIDYFALILFAKDLMTHLSSGDLVVKARIHKSRKQCFVDTYDTIDGNPSKTKVSFKCQFVADEYIHSDFESLRTDPIKIISFDIQTKHKLLVTFCSFKSYSFSDSCGSTEKPLHSTELSREKSFTIFGCDEDFYLEPINSQKVVCDAFGNWDAKFPRCLARSLCALPAMDANDHYIHVEYKYLNYLNGTPNAETGSKAIYSCRSGNETDIELFGDNKRFCIKGFWSGSQPKCLKKGTDAYNLSEYKKFHKYNEYINTNKSDVMANPLPQAINWYKIHLVVISMLVSFLIGASFIGLIVFLVMKYVVKNRQQRANQNIPSVVVSEPNHYYERNTYEEYRYESIRLNTSEFLELERINSLYQSNNGLENNAK
ncbi:unnamed protein product [Medioppia subpectinata]|uniref:Sushi domain-containing protein n=1 Tax=Medioppia subpectinata TaxID=1979941 RepID=A0A7R9KVZ0_9ACAR|nr:unnamed protein product [Medioppia subpectinata]CAG2110737.1 unnamed protein product [Medioppia subpectinata]